MEQTDLPHAASSYQRQRLEQFEQFDAGRQAFPVYSDRVVGEAARAGDFGFLLDFYHIE